jgi:hypothetical protein
MPEEEPQPQPTDAVLGGTNTQPGPYDAVLGGMTKGITLKKAVRRIDQAAKEKLTELDLVSKDLNFTHDIQLCRLHEHCSYCCDNFVAALASIRNCPIELG